MRRDHKVRRVACEGGPILFRSLLELGLVAAVLYHSFNGIKILLVDFFPRLAKHIRVMGIVTLVVFVAAMIPITWIMGGQIVDLIRN